MTEPPASGVATSSWPLIDEFNELSEAIHSLRLAQVALDRTAAPADAKAYLQMAIDALSAGDDDRQ